MASATKIMAALMTLKRGNLDVEAAVSRTGATFDLRLQLRRPRGGGNLGVRKLLMTTLISSGDDTYALVERLGGGAGVWRLTGRSRGSG